MTASTASSAIESLCTGSVFSFCYFWLAGDVSWVTAPMDTAAAALERTGRRTTERNRCNWSIAQKNILNVDILKNSHTTRFA